MFDKGAAMAGKSKTNRRGRDEGSIYQDIKRDLWVGRVNLGWIDGKRQRKVLYGKTRKEVADKLKALQRDQQMGVALATNKQSVADYMQIWLAAAEVRLRPKTMHSYREMARLHIIPTLGKIHLQRLVPEQIDRLLTTKLQEGLSPRTVQYIRAILRMMLAHGLRRGIVARNVAALTDAPHVDKYEAAALNPAQARLLLDTARGDRLEALYRVALTLGLRRGEAIGLRWTDIDWERKTLRIARQITPVGNKPHLGDPKSKAGIRSIPLPGAIITALREHQERQDADRQAAGARWQDSGYILTNTIGGHLQPAYALRAFHALLDRAGLPRMRFHDLRHSCASLLAAQGVPARVSMQILGHSNVSMTQDTYTHVFDEGLRDAADAMDRTFEDTMESIPNQWC